MRASQPLGLLPFSICPWRDRSYGPCRLRRKGCYSPVTSWSCRHPPWPDLQPSFPPCPLPTSLFPTLLCCKLPAMSLPWALEMRTMEKCFGGRGRCWYLFRGSVGSCTMVLMVNILVLCWDPCRKIIVYVCIQTGHTTCWTRGKNWHICDLGSCILCSVAS